MVEAFAAGIPDGTHDGGWAASDRVLHIGAAADQAHCTTPAHVGAGEACAFDPTEDAGELRQLGRSAVVLGAVATGFRRGLSDRLTDDKGVEVLMVQVRTDACATRFVAHAAEVPASKVHRETVDVPVRQARHTTVTVLLAKHEAPEAAWVVLAHTAAAADAAQAGAAVAAQGQRAGRAGGRWGGPVLPVGVDHVQRDAEREGEALLAHRQRASEGTRTAGRAGLPHLPHNADNNVLHAALHVEPGVAAGGPHGLMDPVRTDHRVLAEATIAVVGWGRLGSEEAGSEAVDHVLWGQRDPAVLGRHAKEQRGVQHGGPGWGGRPLRGRPQQVRGEAERFVARAAARVSMPFLVKQRPPVAALRVHPMAAGHHEALAPGRVRAP